MKMQSIDGETSLCQPTLSELISVLDIGEELFWTPGRLVQFEHWVGHIPFAFWIMKVLKPRSFLELGTHRGNSYCAMCQAVTTLCLDSIGYAVDTWQGDLHMAREDGVLEDLRSYHDPRYGSFSTLLPMTFDAGRGMFSDGSIDLLHIDGVHTYAAARHDFENWLPTLSSRGVILFHDTNVRKDDFGVWRLWEELIAHYPAFYFPQSNGLGVLGVGADPPEVLRTLFDMASNRQASARIRALFALRGDALIKRLLISQAEIRLDAVQAEAEQREAALRTQAAAELGAVKAEAEQREAALRTQAAAELGAVKAEAEQREAALHTQAAAELRAVKAEAEQRQAVLRTQAAAQLSTATARAQREIALRAEATARLKAVLAKVAQSEQAVAQSEQAKENFKRVAEAAMAQINAIDQSTMWRMLHPARLLFSCVPTRMRRLGRRVLKLTWWTLTLQLPRRVKELPPARL
jgi:hypothetical protein